MVDEITDDLKDTQDITKAISELMSGDLQSAAGGVGDKVREIQDALADAQITGSELKIEDTTFKNLASLIAESQNAIQGTAQGASIFAEKLEDIADHQELINTISQTSAAIAQDQIDYQNQLANTTGLTAGEVRKIQIEIGKLDQMADFLKSVEASVGATNNLASAQAEVAKQTQQFIDKQKASAISVGNTLKTVKDLDKEVAKVNNTSQSLGGSMSGFGSPEPLEWDTTALDDAYDRFREIQDNIRNGDMSANIEITGNNEMEKLISDLTAAQAAADRLTVFSELYANKLAAATDKASALKAIQQERERSELAITELQKQIPDRANEVAMLERSLAVETAKLKILPEGTTEYNIQKELFEQVEANYIQQSTGLKGIQAEIEQLTSFKDDYLGKQQEDIKNSKDIQTTLQKSLSDTTTLASSSALYSSQLGEAANNAKKYGNNFRGLAEQLGPTFDSAIDGIKSAKDNILGMAGSIPIFGGMIQKNLEGPFNKATDIISDGIGEGLNIMKSKLADNKSVTEAMSAGFGHMGKAIKDAGAMLKAAFSGPMLLIGSILLLIGMAVKRFMDLEAKSLEFRQELGLAADSTKDIESAAADVNRELAGFGVTLDHAYEAANALTRELGSTMLVTKEQIKMVSMMNAGLGISAENAVGVYEVFKNLSGGSSEVAKNLSLTTVALSTAAGVPLDQVMGDIAGASETVYAMSRGTGVELAVAAIEARRLGTNIESISSAMEQQLDFESSITNEMKMASMLGQHISMDAMRQAAFAGDQVRYMEEQQKVMAQIGDLSEMNMYQRKSIAAAMGMEVGELMKMQTQTKALAALENGTAEQRKALAEYQKQRNAALEGETKSLAEQGMEILKQQQAENVRTRMAAAFNELVTELGSVLLPVVESAMNILVPIVSTLVKGFAKLLKVVEFLMQPFIFIGNIISAITGDTEGLKKQFDGIGASLFAIGGIILGTLAIFNQGLISGVLGKIPLIGGGLKKVFESSTGFMKKHLFDPFKDGISGMFGDAEGASEGFFGKMKDKVKGMFGGGGGPEAPGPLKKDGTPDMRFKANKEAMKPGVPDISDDAVPDVDPKKGDKFKEFIEKFNQIDMTQVIKAAAALVILSAALYVTAKALNEFNTVEWSSLVKGTLALGILIGGLYALSQVLDKAKSSLIKGAAALLIMGAALIPVAYAFNLMGSIDFVSVLLAGIAIAGFAVMAAVLGYVAPYIIAGSVALAVLGVALIPAAIAFNLFGAVNWGSVFLGILAIGVLAVAAAFMGSVAPLIIAGAIAIGALGLALIPFGIAAILAGAGMALIGFGIQLMVTGLEQLNMGHILMLYGLAGAIFMFALLSPVILVAGFSMLAFSAALALAGIGVMIFGFAMSLVVETLKELPAAAGGIFVFAMALAMLAPLTPLILLTAGALLFLGVAMLPLAVSMLVLGAGIALLGLGFQMLRDSNAAGMLIELGFAMSFIAMMAPFITIGAAVLAVLTAVLIPFSIAVAVAGIGMMLFGIGLNLTADALQKLGANSVYLIGFAIAVSIVGAMLPLIILGAVAMVILAAALIPLGVAAMIAGVGLMAVGVGMDLMASALEDLDVGKILGLAFTFAIMGAMIPMILLGAFAMGIMASAMIPLAVAAAIAGVGMYMFASAFEILADSLSKVTIESVLSLIGLGVAMMFLGAMAPFAILASLALAVFAVGLGAFGIAAAIVAPSMDILAKGFAILALSLEHIAATAMPALVGLTLLGLISPLLFVAAAGMAALAIPTLLFGVAAGIAAPGIAMLSGSFYLLATALSSIGETAMATIIALGILAIFSPMLFVAAAGILALSASMFALGIGMMFIGDDSAAILIGIASAVASIGESASGVDLVGFVGQLLLLAASAPLLLVAGAGLLALSGPMVIFGVASLVASVGVGALAVSFTFLAAAITAIGEQGAVVISSLMGLALVAPLLLGAAAGIMAVGASMVALAVGLFFLDEDDVAVLETLGEAMANIGKGAKDLDIGTFSEALTTLVDDSFLSGIYLLGDAILYLASALSELPTEPMQLLVDLSSAGGIGGGEEGGGIGAESIGASVAPPTGEGGGGFLGGLFDGLFGGEDKAAETSTIIQTQKAIVISEGGGESPQEQLDMPTGADAGGADSSLAEIIAQIVNAPAQNNAAAGGGDSAGVEAKLDELIDLMKSGKIGVHMDGRKVESQLARVAP